MEKTRILIVEDEQVVALGLQASLEGLGYAVAARVATGEAAIEKAGALRPDLVLMDINLAGGLDGIEAAEQIRAQFDLPIIYLTALSDTATLQRARVSEPFGYILKPFEERELQSNIEMALYKHRLERQLRDSERKFRSIFTHASDGIVLMDHAGAVIEWNQSAEHITGLTRAEVVGCPICDVLFHLMPAERRLPAEHERIKSLYLRLLTESGAPWVGQLHDTEIQRRDGLRRAVQSRSFPIETDRGFMAGAVIRDITEHKRTESAERDQRRLAEALRDTAIALNSTLKSEEVFERILDNIGRVVPSDSATLMLMEEREVRFASHRGYAERGLANYVDRAHRKIAEFPTLQSMFETQQPCVIVDVQTDARWVAVPETFWVRSYVGVPVCVKGRVVGFLNLDSATPSFFTLAHAEQLKAFADQAAIAIENARLYEQAHQLSITDMLTGLYNRRHFFKLAEAELARGRRYGQQVAAIMMDLDHFKEVNDRYGHLVGDAVLQQVAHRLQGQLRIVDMLARYGGEEFVALLPETGLEQGAVVADRLRECVAESPITAGDAKIRVTLSLGIALCDQHTVDLDSLLKCADNALYAAKEAGRNRVSVYSANSTTA
jgi:diguanylate cyclase (GGDEF)-like protein/PAS domain S-box-containing protein